MTTADGRSPGSRVLTFRRLPGTRDPSGHMTEDSPLTVAGAAAALSDLSPALRSLLIPRRGTVALKSKGIIVAVSICREAAGPR